MEKMSESTCPQPDRSGYEELRPSVTRRQIFGLAAASLAALGLSSQANAAFAAGQKVKAGKVTAIPVGGVKGFTLKGTYIIVTQPKTGTFKAFSGTCTHQGQRLSSMSGTSVICASHGAKFNSTTGKVTGGPATRALKTYVTSVSGGFVYVTI
jgi:nitrite reductase/ring-hydroxylating ferredoxin subunit